MYKLYAVLQQMLNKQQTDIRAGVVWNIFLKVAIVYW